MVPRSLLCDSGKVGRGKPPLNTEYGMALGTRGVSVQEAYREYVDGNFRVNRNYQRMLVWSSDEKAKLIDSVLSGYPIPLVLLAYEIRRDGSKSFEILAGMQRLNALFAFIEDKFPVDGKYFDVTELARAKQRHDDSSITVDASKPRLSREECARLLEYTLAVTEFPLADPCGSERMEAKGVSKIKAVLDVFQREP